VIHYVTGDATQPIVKPAAILHICNNKGAWGAGFVMAVSKRWKLPEQRYGFYARQLNKRLHLGTVQPVTVEPDVVVFNMIAQDGFSSRLNPRPVNYIYTAVCMEKVARWIEAKKAHFTIHMPRIGCGLGGGDWSIIEPLIEDAFVNNEVFVYDLPIPV
jgi:O-acetyl-ADP-ribose deacetylase (regulator of RNase III)